MTYIKSQDELDLIFQEVTREIEERDSFQSSIKTFDFTQSDLITRNAKKIVENVHENFSKEVAAHLNNKLRANVNVQLVSLDQQPFLDFMEGMEKQSCFYVFKLEDLEREAVLEIHPYLAFYIVDRIMGGPGDGNQLERELTKIEQIIMGQLVDEILALDSLSWSQVSSFKVASVNYYSSPNYIQFAKTTESIVSATFEVAIEDTQNMLVLSYPYYLINDLLPEMDSDDTQFQVSNARTKSIIQNNLQSSVTPVAIKLGQSKLSLEELINLQQGDVILLNKQTSDNLDLIVGEKPRFFGKAGTVKNRLAFKVIQRFQNS